MSKCFNCEHHNICVIHQTIVMHPEVEAQIKACQHYCARTKDDAFQRQEVPNKNSIPTMAQFKASPITPPDFKMVNAKAKEIKEPEPVSEKIEAPVPVKHESIQPQMPAAEPPIFDSLSKMSKQEVRKRALNMDAAKINDLSSRIHALQKPVNRQQNIVRSNFALTAEDDDSVTV